MQALREKNQFINSIMDNSTASIFAKDVDGRYLFVNPRFMDSAGRPVQEVLGKTDFGLFDNDIAEVFRRGDKHVLETSESIYEEVEILLVVVWSTGLPQNSLAQRRRAGAGPCGISLDCTDLQEAETSLRRLTHAVEQSPVSVAMTDTEGRILSVNPYFCSVSGYCEEDIIGRRFGFMLADGDVSFYDPVWKEVAEGSDWHGEVRNQTRRGDILWESLSISSVRDNQDRLLGFVVIKDDITERKRLERLERDVERIVRHDLKSPIMSFIWVPRTLRKAENITEGQAQLLHELEQSGHRLLKMVNLSLDIFKMEEGTYELAPEDLNILRIIQNVLHDLKKDDPGVKVSVVMSVDGRTAVDGDCLLVRGEELLLHSMMSNIIKNAMEASGPGEVVTVDCRTGSRTSVSVHNPAVVPEDVRETFF